MKSPLEWATTRELIDELTKRQTIDIAIVCLNRHPISLSVAYSDHITADEFLEMLLAGKEFIKRLKE